MEGETRVRRNAYATEVDCSVTLWPGGKICYTWDSSLSDSADGQTMMELVEDVFDHYMDVSCVEFYPSTASECDGIDAMDVKLVEQTAGCWAHIGCSNNQNTFINVSPECATFGVVTHELFHSLGRYHEQSRNDRDEHIKVNWDAIETEKQGNYKKCSNKPYTDTYDYQSIMHYGDMYFASGSAETMTIIESNKERYQKLMGTQTQLSPNDVVTLNTMYKCYSDGMDVNCAHGGVKKANGDCFCVEPFTGSNCEDVDPALGVIVEVEGESFVESPNFPSNYPVNQKTFIVLQCPAGKR
ncbi:protein SpAN-like [Asterias rubens]|uniref:protein SpAN-like n=1 Tax=Asterias rubens TaxID=7604 RepID=UPI0014558166|nr:protein SpAN-like [Asterias rubens]